MRTLKSPASTRRAPWASCATWVEHEASQGEEGARPRAGASRAGTRAGSTTRTKSVGTGGLSMLVPAASPRIGRPTMMGTTRPPSTSSIAVPVVDRAEDRRRRRAGGSGSAGARSCGPRRVEGDARSERLAPPSVRRQVVVEQDRVGELLPVRPREDRRHVELPAVVDLAGDGVDQIPSQDQRIALVDARGSSAS